MKGLGERKHKILCLAIDEYIKDALPITSQSVQKIILKDTSTATLRNELNALEAMGYLKQLHTSGGRVPTAEGYRYYVANLLSKIDTTDKKLDAARDIVTERAGELGDIIGKVADVISEVTNYPTVVVMDGYRDLLVTDFRIIPLLSDKLMVLMGTIAGYINLSLDVSANMKSCKDASDYLTKNFKGSSIGFITDNIERITEGMLKDIDGFKEIINRMVDGLKMSAEKQLVNIRRTGAAKLLDEGKIQETKKILEILDDKKAVQDAIRLPEDERGITVVVGEDDENIGGCSIVKAPITFGGKRLASIGVLGPQRMDYSTIAAALKIVVNQLQGEDNE